MSLRSALRALELGCVDQTTRVRCVSQLFCPVSTDSMGSGSATRQLAMRESQMCSTARCLRDVGQARASHAGHPRLGSCLAHPAKQQLPVGWDSFGPRRSLGSHLERTVRGAGARSWRVRVHLFTGSHVGPDPCQGARWKRTQVLAAHPRTALPARGTLQARSACRSGRIWKLATATARTQAVAIR